MKINKNNIRRSVGIGLLVMALTGGVGIAIADACIDHTETICPMTKVLNIIPNLSFLDDYYIPTGYTVHQIPEMKKEYEEKGYEVVSISYENLTNTVIEKDFCDPIVMMAEDGKYVFSAPIGYRLIRDENNNPYCVKETLVTEDLGNGLVTTYFETENGQLLAREKVLK